MTQFDLQSFLNKTFYQIDLQSMISGVLDFLEYSESNLKWQRRRDLEMAERKAADVTFEGQDKQFESQYRAQLIEGVEYRFDVSLTQRIRYAALVAFITTVDWCALTLASRFKFAMERRAQGTNQAVHVLSALNTRGKCGFETNIADVENLVKIRNCVVHAAGLVESYEFGNEIPKIIAALEGFSVSDRNYLGPSVMIRRSALANYMTAAHEWLPKLDEMCSAKGLLK